MRKTFLRLLPIALSLGTATTWAQHTMLDHKPMTPTQAALAELALKQLLAATGGDEGLFLKVTGTARLPTQQLFVDIPDAALSAGRISYGRAPQYLVASLWDQAALCQVSNPTAPATPTGSSTAAGKAHKHTPDATQEMHLPNATVNSTRSYTVANTGEWSAVHADGISQALAIDVDPQMSYDHGVPYQNFRFLPTGQEPAQPAATLLKFGSPLTAAYGTKVVYRQQAIVQRGNRVPFFATAQLTSQVPLQFNVRTLGPTAGFYFHADEHRVMHLTNMPAEDTRVPDEDARLGSRVLMSPDGAFLLGREINTPTAGAYSVVDAVHSQRTATGLESLAKVWTTRGKGACGDSELALNTAGDLVAVCDGYATWIYKNVDGTRPCRYLTLSTAGQLLCYSEPVAANDASAAAKLVFSTPRAPKLPDTTALVNTQHSYALTWQQLTGKPQLELTLSGEYSGERVVSPIFSCQDDVVVLPAKPAACAHAVQTTSSNSQCASTKGQLAALRSKTQDTAAAEH